jgi:hypothetical protein
MSYISSRRREVPNSDEYRQKAEYCRQMAVDAPTGELRSDWILAAALWNLLAKEKPAVEHSLAKPDCNDSPDMLPREREAWDGVG